MVKRLKFYKILWMKKILFSKKLLLCGLVLLQATVSRSQNDVSMLFKVPAKDFTASSPLGNGRLGAMAFGRTDRERIVLNEISMWSGGVQDADDPNAIKYLPQIRQLLLEGKNVEAQQILQSHFICKGPGSGSGDGANVKFGCYQTLGDLWINWSDASGPMQQYNRVLRIDSAYNKTSWTRNGIRYTQELIVSAPGQLIAVRLTCSKPGGLSFFTRLYRKERANYSFKKDGQMLMQGILNSGGEEGLHYSAVLKVKQSGGQQTITDSGIQVRNATECMLLVGAGTDMNWPHVEKRGADPLPVVSATIKKAATQPWKTMLQAHVADYKSYFNRCRLNFAAVNQKEIGQLSVIERLRRFTGGEADPDLINLYFNFGRYLLISSSRPGGLPANLQGLWAEEYQTPWNGDYHTDINVQMNYWPAEVTNLADCHQPLFTLLNQMALNGSRTAKIYYGTKGWVTHPITNPWGYTSPGEGAGWGSTTTCGIWAATHLWEHYKYNPDRKFLAEAYPIIKGAAEFFTGILIEEPGHKWLVTAPSNSPENGFILPNGQHASTCMGPTVDMQLGREILNEAIHSARILNLDKAWADSLQKIIVRLAANQISASTGALQEWLEDYKEVEPEHRHTAHMMAVYPLEEITPWDNPDLAKASATTLIRRKKGGTGWAWAWRMALWARLQDGEKAYDFLKYFLTPSNATEIDYNNGAGTYANLFCAGPPFQIDGNFGATAAIAEMLLQSHATDNVIRLLPALPAEGSLQSGSVKGLRARNGFEVSFSWKAGKANSIKIMSEAGLPCNILLKNSFVIKDMAGKKINYRKFHNNAIQFKTLKGKEYFIEINN